MTDLNLIELDDLSEKIPQKAYRLIGQIITAWSALDHTILHLLIVGSDIDEGIAGILLGRMDTRGKFDRLKAIAVYQKDKSNIEALKELRKRLSPLQDFRNEIAHGDLIGTHKKSKELLFVVPKYSFDDDIQETIFHVIGHSLERLEFGLEGIQVMNTALKAAVE